jgi:hypothetical protein
VGKGLGKVVDNYLIPFIIKASESLGGNQISVDPNILAREDVSVLQRLLLHRTLYTKV